MMDNVLSLVKERQIKEVNEFLYRLRAFNTEPIEGLLTFRAVDLNSDEAVEKLRQSLPTISRTKNGAQRCLYAFIISAPVDVVAAFELFVTSQIDESTGQQVNLISMSRRNKKSSGDCLYVGSSALSGLRSRFKQHCGHYKGKNRTFGLKLDKWLAKADVSIEFRYWLFKHVDQDIMQLLEDGLWEELQPLFGKKGKA